jgi:serine/threonine protein kinase
MEYADEPTLDEVPSAAQPIAPLGQTAVAVHYAYQKGILHQDIKPANTMIGAASNPVPNQQDTWRSRCLIGLRTARNRVRGGHARLLP